MMEVSSLRKKGATRSGIRDGREGTVFSIGEADTDLEDHIKETPIHDPTADRCGGIFSSKKRKEV